MTEIQTPPPAPPSFPKKNKPSPAFIFSLFAIFFAGMLYAAYFYGLSRNPPLSQTPIQPVATQPTDVPVTTSQAGEFGDITWLPVPQKIANPDVLKAPDASDFGYSFDPESGSYLVGEFSTGAKLINSNVLGEGPGSHYTFRIIKDSDNQYYFIESLITDKYVKTALNDIFDKTKIKFISYDTLGLLPHDHITTQNAIPLKASYYSSQLFSKLEKPVVFDKSTQGDFYAVYIPFPIEGGGSNSILSRYLYLKLPDSTALTYSLQFPFLFDDNIPYVTFSDGTQNKSPYQPGIPSGCGLSSSNTVIKSGSSLLNGKQEIGFLTSNPSEKIYQIKDFPNELITSLYNSYKMGRDYPSAPPILSLEEFAAKDNHFLYQDKKGDWVIFINSEYAPMVECGKPVIYLYPKQDTEISLRVAADITQSDPAYPQDGWRVLAKPSGEIIYNGKFYPYLFWEGLGKGEYPNYSRRGTLVTQDKLLSTLKAQMSQLGLNAKEAADFLDFWQPKLPTSPFVRLTWLTTQDMNRLAPLSISPRPDTIIRIFLEFEGYDAPVKLEPQQLTAPSRQGFTLVEWGGLLIKSN
ncbi:MAG: hypothetical protein ACOX6N_01855 [Patescibacteria group bacterium]